MTNLVPSYAKLLKDGLIKKEQIPAELLEAVETYQEPSVTTVIHDNTEDELYGAITLQPINTEYNQGSIKILDSQLFNAETVGDNPYPENVHFEIRRVENVYGKFSKDIKVRLNEVDDGLIISVDAIDPEYQAGETLLRLDLVATSSNYEDMIFTIYLNG